MASATFEELVQDAILIARYGQRSGRFSDGSLFVAIQKVAANPAADWGDPEAADLQIAINNAVKLIYPVTLIDLKRWDPYAASNASLMTKSALANCLFVACAISLLLACGYFTSAYKSAGTLIAERPAEKIATQTALINDTIYPLLTTDAKTKEDLKNPGSPLSIAVRGKMEEARAIQRSIELDAQTLYDLTQQLSPIQGLYYQIRAAFYMPPTIKGPYPAGSCNSTEGLAGGKTYEASDSDDAQPLYEIKHQLDFVSQIRCTFGMQNAIDFNGIEYQISDLQKRTDILGLWILPAIYGALGALMYYMRSVLNPILPSPAVAKVFLRVSLGAFAGIAIAWFWAPPLSRDIIVSDVTVGTLAIAFLIGFSIDIFFGLLDRLVTIATTSISNLGGA